LKILYISGYDNNVASGVNKKIDSQCKAIKELGHDCYCLRILNDKHYNINYKLIYYNNNDVIKEIKTNFSSNILFNKIISYFYKLIIPISNKLIKLINLYNFDYIYIRNILPISPKYISFYRKLKANIKKYYEFYTYPYINELLLKKGYVKYVYILFEYKSIERLSKVIDQFILVSDLNSEYEKKRLSKYLVISNGVDVESIKRRTPPALNKQLHILGLGNLSIHHGYDRIIRGIAEYKGPYEIFFHLAPGSGYEEAQKLRKMAVDYEISDKVLFYPPLSGKELDDIFDRCHVAAGSLGLHRIGLQNGSVLKMREYCSRGIPFFYAYYDKDFSNFAFSIKISADESPVDLNLICTFIEEVYSKNNHVEEMRKYAEKNLNWASIMKKLFAAEEEGDCTVE